MRNVIVGLFLILAAPSALAQGASRPSAVNPGGVSSKPITAPLFIGPLSMPVVPNSGDAALQSHLTWNGSALVENVVGGPTWTPHGTVPQVASTWQPKGAGPFSAANYYTAGTGLNEAGPMSVCALAKFTALGTKQSIISKDDGGNRSWDMFWQTNGAIYFYVFGGGGNTGYAFTAYGTGDVVQFICVTYLYVANNTSVLTGYVNGVAQTAESAAKGPINNTAAIVTAGLGSGGANPFLGTLYELAVWNRVLSAGEVGALYQRARMLAMF